MMKELQSFMGETLMWINVAVLVATICMLMSVAMTAVHACVCRKWLLVSIPCMLCTLMLAVFYAKVQINLRGDMNFLDKVHSHVLVLAVGPTNFYHQVSVDLSRDDGVQGMISVPTKFADTFPKGTIVWK